MTIRKSCSTIRLLSLIRWNLRTMPLSCELLVVLRPFGVGGDGTLRVFLSSSA